MTNGLVKTVVSTIAAAGLASSALSQSVDVNVIFDKTQYLPGESGTFTINVDATNAGTDVSSINFSGLYPSSSVISSINSYNPHITLGNYTSTSWLSGLNASTGNNFHSSDSNYGKLFYEASTTFKDWTTANGTAVVYGFTINPLASVGSTQYTYNPSSITINGQNWDFYFTGSPEDDNINVSSGSFVIVPEPGILALLGLGVAGVGLATACRRKKLFGLSDGTSVNVDLDADDSDAGLRKRVAERIASAD